MTAIDAAAGYGFPDAGVAAAAGLWGLDPAVAMLNHGGFGACPIAVLRRQAELRRQMEAEPVRFFLKELPPLRDAARQELASWLGAGPEDLVFLPNATAGVNSVLRSLRFRPGDELLVTDHGYNACTNVARYVARRDAARLVVVAVPLPVESPRQVIDSVLAGVSGRTRLAILDHVTSPSGVVFPIEELVRRLGAVGVDTLVDGAHAPGMISLDLGRIAAMLRRVKGRIVHMVLSRVSPLAVPVLLEIGRESVRSDADEEKLLAEAEAIIAEATGDAEPPRPMRRRPVQTSLFAS